MMQILFINASKLGVMVTRALNKGMPIEQVQRLLGHNKLDTTLIYAQVSQDNVKNAHQRYLG